MTRCDTCGNEYDTPLFVRYRDQDYAFDSLECAIHKLAPKCAHCECRVIGHGVGSGGRTYCCEGCSQKGAEERGGASVRKGSASRS